MKDDEDIIAALRKRPSATDDCDLDAFRSHIQDAGKLTDREIKTAWHWFEKGFWAGERVGVELGSSDI